MIQLFQRSRDLYSEPAPNIENVPQESHDSIQELFAKIMFLLLSGAAAGQSGGFSGGVDIPPGEGN